MTREFELAKPCAPLRSDFLRSLRAPISVLSKTRRLWQPRSEVVSPRISHADKYIQYLPTLLIT